MIPPRPRPIRSARTLRSRPRQPAPTCKRRLPGAPQWSVKAGTHVGVTALVRRIAEPVAQSNEIVPTDDAGRAEHTVLDFRIERIAATPVVLRRRLLLVCKAVTLSASSAPPAATLVGHDQSRIMASVRTRGMTVTGLYRNGVPVALFAQEEGAQARAYVSAHRFRSATPVRGSWPR
jgi:hypothetical protein